MLCAPPRDHAAAEVMVLSRIMRHVGWGLSYGLCTTLYAPIVSLSNGYRWSGDR